VNLPVLHPVKPMLAKRATKLPKGDDWMFEPKWDGFRALLFKDGDDWYLQSRDSKPLRRYFPELDAPIREILPDRCVLDGELVIARNGQLDFAAMQMRLHPAKSRVQKLSGEIPASLLFFDILALDDRDLMNTPFQERRRILVDELEGCPPPLYLTPLTRDRDQAQDWFERFEGAGLDGVIAKAPGGVYTPNKRTMVKVKHERTVECVVGGFRWYKKHHGTHVGSLMLGLYDTEGRLHHVGVAGSFPMARRLELVEELAPYRIDDDDAEGHAAHPWGEWAQHMRDAESKRQRVPEGSSRWNPGKSLSWNPLRPELVVEVRYDQMLGSRFRHTAHFRRWRQDKPPTECTYDQLDITPPAELAELFGS